ncbi:hypothetical protein R1sor_026376 [Riccia sorocarpa]|uniref:Uncharacterized protein n=1 Tax=Riccia sorocarpa TaxID=122646 RepID=A0ABD3GB90_9MARC
MDQLAERLCTEISIVRGETHSAPPDPVLGTGRVTRLHVSGVRPPPVSVDGTIQIPSRHGPLTISGAAADTYRTCNSTYWGVPASIPTREMVTVWGRRWIVKESTIPNTGLGVFAVDRIVRVPGGPQKRRFIDGDPVRTGNIAGYIQSSIGASRVSNAEWHYVDGGHIWFHRFDPPEIEAFSRRARRRLESLRDDPDDDNQDENEEEEEGPVEETFIPEEPNEPDEELQDQAALAEFFNMRFQPTPDTALDIGENHSTLDEDACTPLFKGSRVSKLTATLLLSNLQQKYNVSNSFMDSLYALLAKQLLPEGNVLPDSHRSARRMMSSVGLDYQMVHACPNDCYLYKPIPSATDPTTRVENTRTSCPICGASRYRLDTQGTTCPMKVLRWFPLIPRLLLTYRCPSLADLMRWHHENRSDDGIMRTVGDSRAMQHVVERI